MRVLITGGSGFIGRHVGSELEARGHTCTSFDNGTTLITGRNVFGSVRDAGVLAHHVRQHDAVVHCAAVVGFKRVLADPALTVRTEVEGMTNLLAALKAHPIPMVYTSTSAVYGQGNGVISHEDGPFAVGAPALLSTHYAYGKIAAECLAQAAVQLDHLPIRIARLFNVAGPHQSREAGFVIPRMVYAALKGIPLQVYLPGTQTRTFAHVKDVARGIADLLLKDVPAGSVVNLGGTDTLTMKALAQRIGLHVPTATVTLVESPYGKSYEEVHDRRPDLTRALAYLGYRPTLGIDDILRDVVAEYQEGSSNRL